MLSFYVLQSSIIYALQCSLCSAPFVFPCYRSVYNVIWFSLFWPKALLLSSQSLQILETNVQVEVRQFQFGSTCEYSQRVVANDSTVSMNIASFSTPVINIHKHIALVVIDRLVGLRSLLWCAVFLILVALTRFSGSPAGPGGSTGCPVPGAGH